MASRLDQVRQLRRLMAAADSHPRAHVLGAGFELGLFAALDVPRTPAALAARLGLDPEIVGGWLRVAETEGWVAREGERVRLAGLAGWLADEPSARDLRSLVELATHDVAPTLARLPELARGATRPRYGAPGQLRRAAAVSRLLAGRAVRAVPRLPLPRSSVRLLDVGCATGAFLAGVLRWRRDTRGVGLETDPELVELARAALREREVERRGRIECVPLEPGTLPREEFDLVRIDRLVHPASRDDTRALAEAAFERLAPDGILAIHTPVLTRDRAARWLGTAEAVVLLDLYLRCHAGLDGLPHAADLHALLGALGCEERGISPLVPDGSVVCVWGKRAVPASAS